MWFDACWFCLRVEGEVVQLVVHVDGVELPEVDQLLQGLVDEDDADERGEGLLGEASDVADQRAGVGGDQQQAEERRPQSDAGPQRHVVQTVVTEDGQEQTVRQDVHTLKETLLVLKTF